MSDLLLQQLTDMYNATAQDLASARVELAKLRAERDEAEHRYLDIMAMVDYVPPGLSPGWNEFYAKVKARHETRG